MQQTATKSDQVWVNTIRALATDVGVVDITDEEARAAVIHFTPPEEDYRPTPPDGTPEYFEELERLAREGGPALTGARIADYIRALRAGQA